MTDFYCLLTYNNICINDQCTTRCLNLDHIKRPWYIYNNSVGIIIHSIIKYMLFLCNPWYVVWTCQLMVCMLDVRIHWLILVTLWCFIHHFCVILLCNNNLISTSNLHCTYLIYLNATKCCNLTYQCSIKCFNKIYCTNLIYLWFYHFTLASWYTPSVGFCLNIVHLDLVHSHVLLMC
jgi:hypothetical protein